MEKIIRGVSKFQSEIHPSKRDFFEKLAEGQSPSTLMITCADSRINPGLITQTEPGDIFVLRNAGNIVPPHWASTGSEEATVEYGVTALGIQHIIVCGHSQCGAMGGLLHPEHVSALPSVADWLRHAEATGRVVNECFADADEETRLDAAIKENVLAQLDNLKTYPGVRVKLAKGELELHGWVYMLATGVIEVYDPEKNAFCAEKLSKAIDWPTSDTHAENS